MLCHHGYLLLAPDDEVPGLSGFLKGEVQELLQVNVCSSSCLQAFLVIPSLIFIFCHNEPRKKKDRSSLLEPNPFAEVLTNSNQLLVFDKMTYSVKKKTKKHIYNDF